MIGFLHREAERYEAEWRLHWGYYSRWSKTACKARWSSRGRSTAGRRAGPTLLGPAAVSRDRADDHGRGCHRIHRPARQRSQAARADLERYAREGGGLFSLLQAVRYPHDEDEKFYNAMFEGFGVRMLHEGLFDPAHTFQSPPTLVFRPMEFFYTANVREHPTPPACGGSICHVTAASRLPGVEALGLDPNWQVVVAGESTAKSYLLGDDNAHDARREGSQQASPPIAAVRSFGRGRLFVYSVHAKHVFINYANRMWPQITESDGDRQAEKPSDGNRLLANALHWLNEPA